MTDLRTEAEQIAADVIERGGKCMRYRGEWIVPVKEANSILPYGPRYLQSLRGTDREVRSITFSAADSPSKHYWYWIVDLLALAKIAGDEDYFGKVA